MENKEGNMETINYISHTPNPNFVGSNPAPATKKDFREYLRSFSFCKNLRYKKEIVHQISV